MIVVPHGTFSFGSSPCVQTRNTHTSFANDNTSVTRPDQEQTTSGYLDTLLASLIQPHTDQTRTLVCLNGQAAIPGASSAQLTPCTGHVFFTFEWCVSHLSAAELQTFTAARVVFVLDGLLFRLCKVVYDVANDKVIIQCKLDGFGAEFQERRFGFVRGTGHSDRRGLE